MKGALLCLAAAALVRGLPAAEPAWLSRVEPPPDPATLAAPRPFRATYRLSWGGLTAARATVDRTLPDDGTTIRTSLKTATAGLTRSLWQMDAEHVAIADRASQSPILIEETDKREDKDIASRVEFTPEGATRSVRTTYHPPSPAPLRTKPKQFLYPHMLDTHSALLHLRAAALATGESHVVLIMTVTNPYLVTLKVLGRETLEIKAGKRPAIRCSLTLGKIGKTGDLIPQKKFKSATVWISDDPERTLLKAEVKVYVGTVMMELERMDFRETRAPSTDSR